MLQFEFCAADGSVRVPEFSEEEHAKLGKHEDGSEYQIAKSNFYQSSGLPELGGDPWSIVLPNRKFNFAVEATSNICAADSEASTVVAIPKDTRRSLGNVYPIDEQAAKVNHGTVYHKMSVATIRDGRGVVAGFAVTLRDATDRLIATVDVIPNEHPEAKKRGVFVAFPAIGTPWPSRLGASSPTRVTEELVHRCLSGECTPICVDTHSLIERCVWELMGQ